MKLGLSKKIKKPSVLILREGEQFSSKAVD